MYTEREIGDYRWRIERTGDGSNIVTRVPLNAAGSPREEVTEIQQAPPEIFKLYQNFSRLQSGFT